MLLGPGVLTKVRCNMLQQNYLELGYTCHPKCINTHVFFLHFVIFFLSHPIDGCFGDTFASSGKPFLAAPAPHSKDGTGVDSHPSISPKFTGNLDVPKISKDCFTPGEQDMAWPWVINLGVQQPQGDASIIFARHKGEVRALPPIL